MSTRLRCRINPNLLKAHVNLAWAYRRQGRIEEAIRAYQAIDLDDYDAHIIPVGLTSKKVTSTRQSVGPRLLCGLTPKGGEENIALGLAYERQGRSEEAIREFQAALRIRPNDAVAHCDLGMVYASTGPHR